VAWCVAKTGNVDAVIELGRLQEVLLLSVSYSPQPRSLTTQRSEKYDYVDITDLVA